MALKIGDLVVLNPNIKWNKKYRKQLLNFVCEIIAIKSKTVTIRVLNGAFPITNKKECDTTLKFIMKKEWRIS